MIDRAGIELVLDIGANAGEYAAGIRHEGYAGKIVSFEPRAASFARLEHRAAADPRWWCRRLALGEKAGTATINVAGNEGKSSSILPMRERHVQSAPESRYESTEQVEVARLDDVAAEHLRAGEPVMLKLDVQGYERKVLAGAETTLAQCALVETELSLLELYEGAPTFEEMTAVLRGAGFALVDLSPEFVDPETFQVLQLNGLFRRCTDAL